MRFSRAGIGPGWVPHWPALRLDTPEKRPCVAQDSLLRGVSQTGAVGMLACRANQRGTHPSVSLEVTGGACQTQQIAGPPPAVIQHKDQHS